MFWGGITGALVSKVAKTIPRELCSQLSKPGTEQQGQRNPHPDPSPTTTSPRRTILPTFLPTLQTGKWVQQVKELALGSKPKTL